MKIFAQSHLRTLLDRLISVGVTQTSVAKRLGISKALLSSMANGTRNASILYLNKIRIIHDEETITLPPVKLEPVTVIDPSEFKSEVERVMRLAGYTQNGVGEAMGLSSSGISYILLGRRRLLPRHIEQLREVERKFSIPERKSSRPVTYAEILRNRQQYQERKHAAPLKVHY